MERPSTASLAGSVIVIVAPFLGLVAAIGLLWETRLSWLNLAMLVAGYILNVLGITIGFHRLFTHKSFKTTPAVTAILGILGSMAVEGPILQWVATHRRHHQHTDQPGDPHTPHSEGNDFRAWLKGIYHAHFGWFFAETPSKAIMDRYVRDLQADRVVRFVSNSFGVWAALGLLIPAVIGLAATSSWTGALTGFIWGGLLRVFFVHHVTWSINSACHLWGPRSFQTPDQSRNNFVFGILAFGEGWHNNHHAFPGSARHGLSWWQFDIGYVVIRILAMCGLVWDVKVPDPERIAAKRALRA